MFYRHTVSEEIRKGAVFGSRTNELHVHIEPNQLPVGVGGTVENVPYAKIDPSDIDSLLRVADVLFPSFARARYPAPTSSAALERGRTLDDNLGGEIMQPLFDLRPMLEEAAAAVMLEARKGGGIIQALHKNPLLVSYVTEFSVVSFCDENIKALTAMQDYHRLCLDEGDEGTGVPASTLRANAQRIWKTFVDDSSSTQICLRDTTVAAIKDDMASDTIFDNKEQAARLYTQAIKEVSKDIRADVFSRFKTSLQAKALAQRLEAFNSDMLQPGELPPLRLYRRDGEDSKVDGDGEGSDMPRDRLGSQPLRDALRAFLDDCDALESEHYCSMILRNNISHPQWTDAVRVWGQISELNGHVAQTARLQQNRGSITLQSKEEQARNAKWSADLMQRIAKMPTCAVFRARVSDVARARFLTGMVRLNGRAVCACVCVQTCA